MVVGVGIALPSLSDPGLSSQSVLDDDRDRRYQAVEWVATRAQLIIDGAPFDLLFDEPCLFYDTIQIEPRAQGACSAGVLVGPSEGTQQNSLLLTVSRMTIRRAEPVSLPPGEDFDFDGVGNDSDNCPLLPNEDQSDSNGDGIGDRCSLFDPFTGGQQADSDGDGIGDAFDNCVWISNPGQEDTGGLTALLGAPDGIGDACTEQRADVELGGSTQIELLLGPAAAQQPAATTTFQLVDFNNDRTLGDTCSFGSGTGSCTLNAAEVRFCPTEIGLQILFGCI